MINSPLALDVQNLRTYFYTGSGIVKAVDGVSFTVRRGEVLGIVGESGSGKTVTCLSIVRLVPQPAGRIVGGAILLEGDDLLKKSEGEMRALRGRKISMVLQDPMTSLNPVLTIGDQLSEPFRFHRGLGGGLTLRESILNVLRMVRIPAPESRIHDYPHQFSGGMKQRACIGMTMSCEPSLLIADEPTTALDVTVQSQILRLLREIRDRFGVAVVLITHDLGVVARVCDRVAVMYAGRIIEMGGIRELFGDPGHPYTEGLITSVPKLGNRTRRLPSIEGQPPSLLALPPGCAFEPRCSSAMKVCRYAYPPQTMMSEGHAVSCWQHIDDSTRQGALNGSPAVAG